MHLPPAPEVPSDQHGRAPVHLRYEDVSQDGRVLLEALPNGVGEAMWRDAMARHPMTAAFLERGLAAILTRYVLEGGEGPFPVDGPFEAEGSFELAHGVDAKGEVERIYLNMWVDITAPLGRTNLAPPPRAGERALAGRMFAEHVFTRLFAPPEERRVLRLDVPGMPALPTKRYDALPVRRILELPEGARPLEPSFALDPLPIVFGPRHTDSNQHVNSLVYMTLFEEAAVRRFEALGKGAMWLGRGLEVGYRKPCFAGQRVRLALRAYEDGERLGAVGGFYAEADAASPEALARAQPHAYVKMAFARA